MKPAIPIRTSPSNRKAPETLIHVHYGLHQSWQKQANERHQIIILPEQECAGTLTWRASDEDVEGEVNRKTGSALGNQIPEQQQRRLSGQHVLFIKKHTLNALCFDAPSSIMAMNFTDEFLAEFAPDAAWRGVLARQWFDLLKVDARIIGLFECARELCQNTAAKDARGIGISLSGEGITPTLIQTPSPLHTAAALHPQATTRHRAISHPHCVHALGVMLAVLLLCANRPQNPDGKGAGLTPEQLKKALDYIETHFTESFRITALYRAVGLSEKCFGKLFRNSTGMLPRRYILMRRVTYAQELLREGRLRMAEIATAAGFADQSHMRHCFRLLCGAEPPRRKRAGLA